MPPDPSRPINAPPPPWSTMGTVLLLLSVHTKRGLNPFHMGLESL